MGIRFAEILGFIDASIPNLYTLPIVKITSAQFVKGLTGDDKILRDKNKQVAFVGRSNVGKSSVINALLGINELARTGKRAGKTTEANFFLVNERYYFVDLPGYGYAAKSLDEREKIREMIIKYLSNKDIVPHTVAIILDGKVGLTDFDRDMLEILHDNGHRAVIILNKADKLTQRELSQQLHDISDEYYEVEILPYSAVNKKGTNLVLQMLVK